MNEDADANVDFAPKDDEIHRQNRLMVERVESGGETG